jgi:hypothetical protein
MPLIVGKSRNPIVREAFALKAVSERRMKRIASMTKAKPEPAPAPKKTAKSPRAKGGKTKKAKG